MRKIAAVFLFSTMICQSAAFAQQMGSKVSHRLTVILPSDCLGNEPTAAALAIQPNNRTGKDTLKGKWDVRAVRVGIDADTPLEVAAISRYFPEESHSFWDLNKPLFQEKAACDSHYIVDNDFWCLKSKISDSEGRPIQESRQLWMGIVSSYFDGLLTINVGGSGTAQDKLKKGSARVMYVLKAVRAED